MLFKRLFIGLLILSALTAEGTAFFSSALAPLQNYMAGLYTEDDDKEPDMDEIPVKEASYTPIRYGIHGLISTDEIIEARDSENVALCFPVSFSSGYYPVVCGQAQINNDKIRDTSNILCASDISPPAVL